jgi:PAS domain S-box-containing protein
MNPTGKTGTPLHRYLMQLYWLCVLPLLLLAGWLAYENVQAIRSAQNKLAAGLASNLAATVDQQLGARISALTVLTQSPYLDPPLQLADLYKEAQGVRNSLGMHVALVEATPPYRMRFNTHSPLTADLPAPPSKNAYEDLKVALSTLQPSVGDVMISPISGGPITPIAMPVVREGRAVYALVTPSSTAEFQNIFDQASLPAGWTVTLKDSLGQSVARIATDGAETSEDTQEDNRFTAPSSLSRWTVALEIPPSARLAPLMGTGIALASLVLAATVAGALGGIVGGRRLGQAVASLTQASTSDNKLQITEIQAAQALLDESATRQRQSEERFRRLFQDAPIGMRLINHQGDFMAQNAEFEALFGYTLTEVPNLSVWMERAYPDPEERQRVARVWNIPELTEPSARRELRAGEFRITAKDGQVKTVQVLGIALPDGMLSSFIDLTASRKTENQLKLWADAFQYAELDLAIGDPATDTVVAANPSFARSRGYTQKEVVGMHLSQLHSSSSTARVIDQMSTLQTHPHFTLEAEHRRKDGSHFPVLLDVTVAHDTQGKPTGRLVYATDLTERKQAEAEIQALQNTLERRVVERTAQLTQANQALDSFAHTLSHDLRAPLRAMNAYLHMLREDHGATLPKDGQQYLDQVDAAVERMNGMIEAILSLSNSTRHEMQLMPVDLSELAAQRLTELARSHPERAQVTHEVEPGLNATGDPRMLDALMSNLIDNAWKYTSKTDAPHIRFFSCEENGVTWYCVADNGAGFDASQARRLFQPFQRLHRESDFPGMGIGLATVQRIVKRHHGTLKAEASLGKGATFCFTLAAEPSLEA